MSDRHGGLAFSPLSAEVTARSQKWPRVAGGIWSSCVSGALGGVFLSLRERVSEQGGRCSPSSLRVLSASSRTPGVGMSPSEMHRWADPRPRAWPCDPRGTRVSWSLVCCPAPPQNRSPQDEAGRASSQQELTLLSQSREPDAGSDPGRPGRTSGPWSRWEGVVDRERSGNWGDSGLGPLTCLWQGRPGTGFHRVICPGLRDGFVLGHSSGVLCVASPSREGCTQDLESLFFAAAPAECTSPGDGRGQAHVAL